MPMLIALLIGLFAALAAPPAFRLWRHRAAWALALVPAGLFVHLARYVPQAQAGNAVRETYPWMPGLGVELGFWMDGLSLLFALLVTGLGAFVVIYAGAYLKGHPHQGRFFALVLFFMSAMLGLVLADDLILLFVFWELTSFSSYLLIGFDHERAAARQAARQALLVTAGGGLALLAGLLMLGLAAGTTFALSEIAGEGVAVRSHGLYLPVLLLVGLGAFTKSAQYPFHFWLPGAMEAPTPVSAYLHSATMVKAGIYLLARLDPVLGGTRAWAWLLAGAGTITMLVGGVQALRNTDLKRILAYSTISVLGMLTVLLGLSFEAGIKAAVVFIVVHALYKGALFMVAGVVDHEAGTRDVLRLGGLWRAMPITAGAAVLAGLSMAGLPPLFGFVGKELVYQAKLGFYSADVVLPGVAVLANTLTAAAAGIVVLRTFFGTRRATPRTPHDGAVGMWIGPAVLGAAGLLFGLFPGFAEETIVAPAVRATLGYAADVELVLWHGFDTALLLSGATLAAGAVLYLVWSRFHGVLAGAGPLTGWGAERACERLMDAVLRLADLQTRLLQNGRLRTYLFTIFASLAALVGGTLLLRHPPEPGLLQPGGPFAGWALALLVTAATLVVVASRSRLAAIASLGVTGFGIALLFVLGGAPDLAMTQFLVETVTVVIVLLVVQRLPRFDEHTRGRRRGRLRDGILALGAGALMTTLVLLVTGLPFDPSLSDFYARESLPGGHGRNVVNVILVDFRALDTLGEITVIAIAALGVLALLRLGPAPAARPFRAPDSLILQAAARFLLALLLVFSVFLFWRGHDAPGGGFIGGLVAAGAFALYGVAFGPNAVRRLLRVHPRQLVAAGLALAVLSGLVAGLAGAPFMAARWTSLPGGDDPLTIGTPLLFDAGVYLVVTGFALTIVLALERGTAAAAGGESRTT